MAQSKIKKNSPEKNHPEGSKELFLLVVLEESVTEEDEYLYVYAVDTHGNLYERERGKKQWAIKFFESTIYHSYQIMYALKGDDGRSYNVPKCTFIHVDDELIPVLEQAVDERY